MREERRPLDSSALQPLYCQLTNEADRAELIAFFLGELRLRSDAIHRAWTQRDWDDLMTLAQELIGAGAGYGYPIITEAAGELDQLLQATEADVSMIGERAEALILLCQRACLASEQVNR